MQRTDGSFLLDVSRYKLNTGSVYGYIYKLNVAGRFVKSSLVPLIGDVVGGRLALKKHNLFQTTWQQSDPPDFGCFNP